MEDNLLKIEWVDPRGKTWDLTSGKQGVFLSVGQSDFGMSPINQIVTAAGTHIATQRDPLQPSLAVDVGYRLSGQAYYDVAEEWWGFATPAEDPGTLRITQPNGKMREAKFRLREAPGTSWDYDPGLPGRDRPVEAWLLQGYSPWWDGARQFLTYSRGEISRYEPFYGKNNSWPLHITSHALTGEAYFRNTGQGPMYPIITAMGPLPSFVVQFGASAIEYNAPIPVGKIISINTEPGQVYAEDLGDGSNVLKNVRIRNRIDFPSIPRGESVRVSIRTPSTDTRSRIVVSATEKFARPF